MDTTVKALQNLYTALGGAAADVENINVTPDMINAIAGIAGGSSGGFTIKTGTAEFTTDNYGTGSITFPSDFAGFIQPRQTAINGGGIAKAVMQTAMGNMATFIVYGNATNLASDNVVKNTQLTMNYWYLANA